MQRHLISTIPDRAWFMEVEHGIRYDCYNPCLVTENIIFSFNTLVVCTYLLPRPKHFSSNCSGKKVFKQLVWYIFVNVTTTVWCSKSISSLATPLGLGVCFVLLFSVPFCLHLLQYVGASLKLIMTSFRGGYRPVSQSGGKDYCVPWPWWFRRVSSLA